MTRPRIVSVFVLACFGLVLPALASQQDVQETVRETILRLKRELPNEELLSITSARVAEFLNEEERVVLGTRYLTFQVNVPVTVYVAIDSGLEEDAFWLRDGGFARTDLKVTVGREPRLVWRKDFPAGQIGLGVNSLRRRGEHYFAVIAPQTPTDSVSLSDVDPPMHTVGEARTGASILADTTDDTIGELPAEMEGQVLLRGYGGRTMEAHIAGEGSSAFFRTTSFPSTERPDGITLTMGEDPTSSMTVQWRTSTAVSNGVVRYQKKALVNTFDPAPPRETVAKTVPMEDLGLVEDAVVHRHFATLEGLEPATTYVYSVGDGSTSNWSEFNEFTTAPAQAAPFSFLYMGDIQQGYDRWASVRRRALLTCPDAAFCLTAGDQVNRGMFRDHWDELFHYADGFFADVPFVPVVGNHEMYQDKPELYLAMFHLPHNAPSAGLAERAYSFEYGQVLVVCLDMNFPLGDQASWLEERLASSDAVWKTVLYHHPAYSAASGRNGEEIREVLGPIFDAHEVDIAFQGHDHGYLRTYPMRDRRRTADGEKGTIYLVSTAGAKMYDVAEHEYGEVTLEDTATFQVVDVLLSPHRLVYRAYDVDGNLVDEFVLQK